jgi:hypothetical protein
LSLLKYRPRANLHGLGTLEGRMVRLYRREDQRSPFRVLSAVVLTGALGLGGMAGAQTQAPQTKAVTMPDAQVEANLLKALAGAPDLANQAITTTTVYGEVTLSGSVETEALRTEAETIASRTPGVKKVIDELTLGAQSVGTPATGGASVADAQGTNPMLQSDGTMASASPQGQAPVAQGSPDSDNTAPAQSASQAAGPSYGPGAPEYRRPYAPQGQPQQGSSVPQPGYGPPQQGYPRQAYSGTQQPVYGGQEAGQSVTVPSGALVRIRINQSLDSGRTEPGATFDGIVVNDVVAGGVVAIPRGAAIQGTVVDAKKSGALKGRGELSLQLTQVTLGGQSYPVVSDVWGQNGGNKTTETINKTAIGGGIGALIGAAAGGGAGAAIGAGVGGALGLGSSAASGNGQVYVPSEGLLTFHLAQPATVATVSQQEMDRLAQGVPPGAQPQPLRRRYAYPAPYYGPIYYRPYPYPY